MTSDGKESETKKPEMEYRMLGGTGLKVSVLGFGAMTFDSVEETQELIECARSFGCNFFDNAELYGEPTGSAETFFGEALKRLQLKDPQLYRRSDLVITTKLYFGGEGAENSPGRSYAPNEIGLSRKHLMEGTNDSLRRLQLDYVDVIYAHRYDPLTPMEEIVRGFTDIIRSGKALYWGTSMWTAQKITEAYWVAKCENLIPPVVEQPIYNMFARDLMDKGYLRLFEQPYKLGTTIWSPLAWGLLTGKYNKGIPEDSRLKSRLGKWFNEKSLQLEERLPKITQLADIAEKLNSNIARLALAWVVKNKNVSVCLLGARKVWQLEDNFASLDLARRLDDETMDQIEKILENKPELEANWGRVLKKTI